MEQDRAAPVDDPRCYVKEASAEVACSAAIAKASASSVAVASFVASDALPRLNVEIRRFEGYLVDL